MGDKKDLTDFLNSNTKKGEGTWVKTSGGWYEKENDKK